MRKFIKKMKKSLLLLSVCVLTAFVANATLYFCPKGMEYEACDHGMWQIVVPEYIHPEYGAVTEGFCGCWAGWTGPRCDVPKELIP